MTHSQSLCYLLPITNYGQVAADSQIMCFFASFYESPCQFWQGDFFHAKLVKSGGANNANHFNLSK